ncbi:MAG: hypothetical protein LAT67_08230 [Balneolales bacterium]|nr:hypothetical protein [Balneolales bacterium]
MKSTLPSAFLFLFMVLGNSAIFAADRGEPFETKVFSIDGPADLFLSTSGGSLRVEKSANHNELTLEVYVMRGRERITPGTDISNQIEIEFEQVGNSIKAIAKTARGLSRSNLNVSFTVYAPEQTSTNLTTSGGSIRVAGLNGDQRTITSGGSINISTVEGNIEAQTSGGSIRLEQIKGDINGSTSGGSITAEQTSGELKLTTSGGSIRLAEVSGNVQATTSGGSIRAGIRETHDFLQLTTSGGSIRVTLPLGLAHSSSGISIDARGSRVQISGDDPDLFVGQKTRNRVSGSYGDGSLNAVFRTNGGNVNIQFE